MQCLRHILFIIPVFLVPVSSCINIGTERSGEGETGRMTVSIRGYGSGPRAIEAVSFDASTGLPVSRADGSGEVSLSVPKGRELFCAAGINLKGALYGMESVSGLEESGIFLKECNPDSFPATALCQTALQHDSTVVLDAVRLVSKVSVGSLDFSRFLKTDADQKISVRRLFLLNVNGFTPLSGNPAEGKEWYNALALEKGLPENLKGMLVKEMNVDATELQTVPVDAVFYCCPNPVEVDVNILSNPEWSPRRTRLVVELVVAGRTRYYPVTLPPMECNTEYRIEKISILGEGSDSPDIPVKKTFFIEARISVLPWREGEENCTLSPITFCGSSSTRMSETVSPGTIYVTASTGSPGSYSKYSTLSNAPYDCASGRWKSTAYYWPDQAVPINFIAVNRQLRLSVSSGGTTSSISTDSGDLIYARSLNVTGPDPVRLGFVHLFAYVAALRFEAAPGVEAEVQSVKCRYAKKQTFDLTAGVFKNSPTYGESEFNAIGRVEDGAGCLYPIDLLTIPGSVELLVNYRTFHGGVAMEHSGRATVNLASGCKTTVNILLAEDRIEVIGDDEYGPETGSGQIYY